MSEHETVAPNERRHHRRVPIEMDVEIEALAGDGMIPGRSRDVSLGGARVRVGRSFPHGEAVVVAVAAEDRVVVSLGEVLDASKLGEDGTTELRIRFRNLGGSRRDHLEQLLDSAVS